MYQIKSVMDTAPSTIEPRWANSLVDLICRKANVATIPVMHWRYKNRKESSGRTRWVNGNHRLPEIYMTIGNDVDNQMSVLIHELCHFLLPVKEGHSYRFWKLFYVICQEVNFPHEKAYQYSQWYKKTAISVYRELVQEGFYNA